MSYRLIVRPEAEADIRNAYSRYENEVPGLGVAAGSEFGALQAGQVTYNESLNVLPGSSPVLTHVT